MAKLRNGYQTEIDKAIKEAESLRETIESKDARIERQSKRIAELDRQANPQRYLPELSQQRGDEAGQDIAAAGSCQPRITAGVDEPLAGGCGNDCAAALECNVGIVGSGVYNRNSTTCSTLVIEPARVPSV